MSRREAARIFGINRRTVEKMLMFSIPPGYRRDKVIRRPKLDGFTGIIDQILEAVNSDVRCNIVGGFDIRLSPNKKTMLPCQDILTTPVPKGIRSPT